MDVKLNMRSARPHALLLGSLALAISFSQITQAVGEVVFASDSEVSSTVFITDDAPSEPPQAPASVEGSVVFVEDAPAPIAKLVPNQATARFVPPQQPAQAQASTFAQGDLKVVSNPSQPTAKLTAIRPIPKQLPLVPLAKPSVASDSSIQMVAATEPAAVVPERDQPGDIQIAVHAEPVLGPIKKAQPANVGPEGSLIAAYQLSLKAKSAAEYTEIAQSCAEALRHQIKADQRGFARQLSSWALNRRGQLRAEEGEQELASADFLAALEFNPRNWRALHNRGVSFAQAGSFAEAFDDFNTVIQINPKYAKAYANRATLYVQAKDLDAAIKDYERAIQQDENFATAHVGLGRVCHMLGRWDDAIQHFSSAITIEPTSPDILCSRGDLHADMGNYGEALADYARTIEIDPEFAHAYRNGAWLLATCPDERFRDPENAVLGAQQALEYSYGERHVALDTLAAALASNGQFDAAVSTVTKAVDLAPENTKFTYLSRLQLYQENQPFRTETTGDVSQATFEASDQ